MQSPKLRTLMVGLILFVALFFSMGKIRYALNPILRSICLQQFLSTVKQDAMIDPEKFWEFRDFYAATTSSFKPQNIATRKPFLTWKTGYFESSDFLIPTPIDISYPMNGGKTVEILFRVKNEIIYMIDKKLYIRFTKPQSEMLKANGFFRYFGVDLEQYKDYLWYNETVLDL
jgi:hypothetical protein